MIRPPFPITICGPSGVGKTVLVDRLLTRDPPLIESVSATTRAPRSGEVNGVHYHFQDKAGFEKLIAENGLLEWALVHGFYYGTPLAPLEANLGDGRWVILNIDVQGAANLRKLRADAALIFVLPPSMSELESRLRERGMNTEEEIAVRLRNAREEISAAGQFDYFVVNDDVERAVGILESIIRLERGKWGKSATS